MKQSKYPSGWDQERVRRVLEHYESQTDEKAVAERRGGAFRLDGYGRSSGAGADRARAHCQAQEERLSDV